MMINSSCHVWLSDDGQRCFLIPEGATLTPGPDQIADLRGRSRRVALTTLAGFACTPEQARAHLDAAWQAALDAARLAWLDLAELSHRTGQALDLDELGRQLREGLGLADEPLAEALAAGQAVVEAVTAAAHDPRPVSEAEQRAAFRQAFGQLPRLLEQLNESSLERAAEDPDAWARSLYQQVFGELDRQKQERRRQELAHDIGASIAARLREAGLAPAADVGREEGGGEKRP